MFRKQPRRQSLRGASTQKFTGLTDLKSVPGVDAPTVDAKARLIFFK